MDALQMNGKSPKRRQRPEVDIGDEEEASETTGLLGVSEREEKRDRIAKIALNGQSLYSTYEAPSSDGQSIPLLTSS